jgi:hypothetical protein
MAELITIDEVKAALPQKKGAVTQEAVDIINSSLQDPEFQGESLLKTACIYENVLKGARASVPEFLNAIRFCAYISTTESNYTEAYKRVFMDREFVKSRLNEPTDSPRYIELTSAASRYRRSKLVVDLLTVSQVPLDLIFSGQRYKAIGVLAGIMENGRYDRDRVNAAKELLAATKGADNVKIELDVGVKENTAVKQLQEQLANIASKQKRLLEHGVSDLNEFGAMKVVEADLVEEEEPSGNYQ